MSRDLSVRYYQKNKEKNKKKQKSLVKDIKILGKKKKQKARIWSRTI